MPQRNILVQTSLTPSYYQKFHCLMDACQDTCCGGWAIEFNKKDFLKIKRTVQSGALKEKMDQALTRLRTKTHDDKYAEIRMSEAGRCPFHSDEGLCLLQLEYGEAVLPDVCRTFPRGMMYTAAALERTLSPTCEGLLALLWELPEGIDFIEEPLAKKDCKMYKARSLVEARFGEIRALCIDVIQERALRVPQRLTLLGLLFQQLGALDWEDGEAVDHWLLRGEALLHMPELAAQLDEMPRDRETYLNYNYELFRHMRGELGQELNRAMADIHIDAKKGLVGGFDGPRYQELERRLEELLGHSEYFFENLLVAITFGKGFPALVSPETLWKSYVSLCAMYSVYRCAAVCACGEEASRERLFHALVYISRQTLHNNIFMNKMTSDCFEKDNASLAYLTILVNG